VEAVLEVLQQVVVQVVELYLLVLQVEQVILRQLVRRKEIQEVMHLQVLLVMEQVEVGVRQQQEQLDHLLQVDQEEQVQQIQFQIVQ